MQAKREKKSAWRRIGRPVAFASLALAAPMAALALFSWVLNPAMMALAGRRHFYAAVLRHRGRRSGREYVTPVMAVPVAGDAFLVPLPYGEEVDWLKNVLAAGRATIEAKGETHELSGPEVIGAAEAFPLLDERHRRTWRRFGIERFLRAKVVCRDP